MNDEGLQVGQVTFEMTRTRPDGSAYSVKTYENEKYPDATGVTVSVTAYLWIPEQGKEFTEHFRFEDAELATNYASWDFSGNLTSDFHHRDLQEGKIILEASAMNVPTSGPLEAKLTLRITKRSTGEVFSPRFNVGLVSNQGVMEIAGPWEAIHQVFPIKLLTTVPEQKDPPDKAFKPEVMDYNTLLMTLGEITKDDLEEMKAALASAPNPDPNPGGSGEIGPVPNTPEQPWYIDQALYEQSIAAGGPESAVESLFIDSVRRYYQTLNQFIAGQWELEANHHPILIRYQETVELMQAYNQYDASYDYQWWSLTWVVCRLITMVIESLPGFAAPSRRSI